MLDEQRRRKEQEDEFATSMFNRLAEKAEPFLKRKLVERGVSDFRDLGREGAKAVWREALLEATALYAPDADMDGMRRATTAFTDDRFIQALQAERPKVDNAGAFDPARGRDAAILLAGFGLPVLPLDRKTLQPLAESATTIDEADRSFNRFKTAIVGYEPARAPFFLAVTDCVNTLAARLQTDPRFAEAKRLMTRGGGAIPPTIAPAFKHGAILIARLPGDELETIVLEDPSPNAGSIMLLGGWMDGEEHRGVPRPQFMVPQRLLTELLDDPSVIHWLTRPVAFPQSPKAH